MLLFLFYYNMDQRKVQYEIFCSEYGLRKKKTFYILPGSCRIKDGCMGEMGNARKKE